MQQQAALLAASGQAAANTPAYLSHIAAAGGLPAAAAAAAASHINPAALANVVNAPSSQANAATAVTSQHSGLSTAAQVAAAAASAGCPGTQSPTGNSAPAGHPVAANAEPLAAALLMAPPYGRECTFFLLLYLIFKLWDPKSVQHLKITPKREKQLLLLIFSENQKKKCFLNMF